MSIHLPPTVDESKIAWQEAFDPQGQICFVYLKDLQGSGANAYAIRNAQSETLQLIAPKPDEHNLQALKGIKHQGKMKKALLDFPNLVPLIHNIPINFNPHNEATKIKKSCKNNKLPTYERNGAYILKLGEKVEISFSCEARVFGLRIGNDEPSKALTYVESLVFDFWQDSHQGALRDPKYRDTFIQGLPKILKPTGFTVVPRNFNNLNADVWVFINRL